MRRSSHFSSRQLSLFVNLVTDLVSREFRAKVIGSSVMYCQGSLKNCVLPSEGQFGAGYLMV